MQLEGHFYRIEQIESVSDGVFSVRLVLCANHPVYEGHFPGQPVVPGVCTLTIIKECLGKILSRKVGFASIKECKFVSALVPQNDLRITVNLSMTESTSVKAVVVRTENQQTVLKLRGTIR